ncbi:caspase family protein [Flavobacterium reichenbachii]|nr:caspase family protein [Flavobacterium reichenbachii]
MALYFNSPRQEPSTHIMIIGVGAYPYLQGGANAIQQSFDGAQLMGQLGSPAVSAEAFYNCVVDLENSNSWITPLGSVEVLVSAPAGSSQVFAGRQHDAATLRNIKTAYRNWKNRCNEHEENTAIFFFCGHGLDNGEQYLLTEDFGEYPDNPWEGSFAFDMTRRAFSSCQAQTQIFLIDSCRQLTPDMLATELPRNPIEPPNRFNRECRYSLVQKAAAPNEAAYGITNDVSFYTKALIGALKGNAADNDAGDFWTVSMGKLSSKMTEFLRDIAVEQGYDQRCMSTTSDVRAILRLSGPPTVPLLITCNPEQALLHASLSYRDLNNNTGDTRAPAMEPWNVNVTAGIYQVGASFEQGGYVGRSKAKSVAPPFCKEEINCI